ncbi:MAG: hypothetical protein AAFY02_03150 [Pseudomonadota bacterium]
MRLLLLLALLVWSTPAAAEQPIAIALDNTGEAPLRCQYLLAHWMSRDALRLDPGAAAELPLYRQADGALFLRQPGEPRPLFVEALLCGDDQAFGETARQLDLSALRRAQADRLALRCDAADPTICRLAP